MVQDQLRVSDGWVRCGRCSEVFNAVERLIDLEAENSIRVGSGTSSAHRERVIDDLARLAGQGEPSFAAPRAETGALRPPPDPLPAPPPVARPEPAAPAWAEGEADAGLDDSRPAAVPPDLRAEPAEQPPPFVRRADRAARWRQPRLRAALAGVAVLAGTGLGLQVAIEYRDLIAARWSVARPALDRVCAWAGCRVEPPRVLDALVVDSSGLVRVDQTALYRLSVVLRNRLAVELAVPAIDLSLTDAQGRVIARRVLSTADLGVSQRSLAASSELPMKAVLSVGDAVVAGYTIEVFYP